MAAPSRSVPVDLGARQVIAEAAELLHDFCCWALDGPPVAHEGARAGRVAGQLDALLRQVA